MNSWLFLLCGLLLAAAPRAHADDPAPSGEASVQAPLAGDLDGDGTLSNKEKRKQRRAERRARRRAGGSSSGTAGDDGGDEADAEDTASAGSRGSAASANASKAAASLKGMLPKGDAGSIPGGGPGGGGPGGAGSAGGAGGPAGNGAIGGDLRGGAPAGGGQIGGTSGSTGGGSAGFSAGTGSGGPANPKTQADFALAARSPYAPAFASTGLKLGPDGKTVLRLDGTPATADDYARLQRAISSMPEALSRRPDFFSAISPERYSDVKNGMKDGKHADTVYKDIGTTPGDRDLVHTASCDKLAGDCNKNVTTPYKKGDFVAPEDLDAMWSALQKELDGSTANEEAKDGSGMPNPGAKRSQVAADAALDAANVFSDDRPAGKQASGGTAVSAGGGSAPAAAGVVAVAATSAKRLWNTVAMGIPGPDGKAKSSTGLMIIIVAAAGMVSLLGVVIARRKG